MPIHEETKSNRRFRIYHDSDPIDPEWGDCPVYLVHFHRQFYRCPEGLPFDGESAARVWLASKYPDWVIFPVSAYIHSGVQLSLGRGSGWDVSNVGFILIKKDPKWWKGIVDEGWTNGEGKIVTWESVAQSHVDTWNKYLSGEVYGFVVEEREECDHCGHVEWELIESCYGFYDLAECIEQGRIYLRKSRTSS